MYAHCPLGIAVPRALRYPAAVLEMISRNMTAPYSAVESWTYDTFIAPAVNEYVRALQADRLAAVPSGGRVLDVGCGGGQNACSVAEARTDLRVTGLDLSADQVRRARRRGASFGDRVQFSEGTALDLPFDDGTFDFVVSVGSIKHWPDVARGVAECARVVRAGGVMLIAEVDRGCLLPDARAFVERWRVPRAMQSFALAGFRTWVAGQGLDLEDARGLLAPLGLRETFAERVDGAPFLIFGGTAQASTAG